MIEFHGQSRLLKWVMQGKSVKFIIGALLVGSFVMFIHSQSGMSALCCKINHNLASKNGDHKVGSIPSTSINLDIGSRFCRDVQPMMDIGPNRDTSEYRSQYGQDIWIERNILPYLKENPKTFLEFGGRDGIHDSNTYVFDVRDGYSGILIEAVPSEYKLLKKNRERKNVTTYHAAVCPSGQEGETKQFVGLTGAFSGLGKLWDNATDNYIDTLKGKSWIFKRYKEERVEISCLNLHRALQSAGIQEVTIMSIDCEGCEEDVLKDFDFSAYSVKVIIVERNEDCDKTRRVMMLLEDSGFIAMNWESSDVIFVHRSVWDVLYQPK